MRDNDLWKSEMMCVNGMMRGVCGDVDVMIGVMMIDVY